MTGVASGEALKAAKVHSRASIAADLALYDLLGKVANVPGYVLLGGKFRPRITVVRMVGVKSPPELKATVGELVSQGLTHFKVKIGTGVDEDVARIRALREAFGDAIWIGVDGNGAYKAAEAIELCKSLETYRVGLIEQPTKDFDMEALIQVTAASPIPIMADQCVDDVASALEVCQRQSRTRRIHQSNEDGLPRRVPPSHGSVSRIRYPCSFRRLGRTGCRGCSRGPSRSITAVDRRRMRNRRVPGLAGRPVQRGNHTQWTDGAWRRSRLGPDVSGMIGIRINCCSVETALNCGTTASRSKTDRPRVRGDFPAMKRNHALAASGAGLPGDSSVLKQRQGSGRKPTDRPLDYAMFS